MSHSSFFEACTSPLSKPHDDRGPKHRAKTQDPHAHAERFRERDHGLPEAFLLVGKHQRQADVHERLRHLERREALGVDLAA